jgi:hypothetical protein
VGFTINLMHDTLIGNVKKVVGTDEFTSPLIQSGERILRERKCDPGAGALLRKPKHDWVGTMEPRADAWCAGSVDEVIEEYEC